MSESQFYGFFTGGLGLLIIAGLMIAWQLWRLREEEREGAISALDGVSHELRINLQRMVNEIAQIADVEEAGPEALLPIQHPQLDGVNASLIRTNRNAIAVIGATYQELEARKMALRAVLAQRRDTGNAMDDAMDATIDGIATLYMWEEHGGARPNEVGSVRSWHVRDWMKGHGFAADMLPGLHLRDEVVERLRQYGLHLTPRPLTHTAHEYYSLRYDRHADPHGPFWRRKKAEEVAGEDEDFDEDALLEDEDIEEAELSEEEMLEDDALIDEEVIEDLADEEDIEASDDDEEFDEEDTGDVEEGGEDDRVADVESALAEIEALDEDDPNRPLN